MASESMRLSRRRVKVRQLTVHSKQLTCRQLVQEGVLLTFQLLPAPPPPTLPVDTLVAAAWFTVSL